jgi:hypothetical protein
MGKHVEIPVGHGRVALVDEQDKHLVEGIEWFSFQAHRAWYAATKTNPRVYMHRLIMDAPQGMEVDHIDGDGLNNTRDNLRVCTHQQNLANQRHQLRDTHSRYKGVTFCLREKLWKAQIKANQQHINLGTFKNEDDAARAYNRAALQAWGEFARLNDVGE